MVSIIGCLDVFFSLIKFLFYLQKKVFLFVVKVVLVVHNILTRIFSAIESIVVSIIGFLDVFFSLIKFLFYLQKKVFFFFFVVKMVLFVHVVLTRGFKAIVCFVVSIIACVDDSFHLIVVFIFSK